MIGTSCLLAVALASCSGGPGAGVAAAAATVLTRSAGSGGTVPALDPGTKAIHRLNSTEYNATVTDVLGTSLQPANGSWRGGELAGFDNIASVLGVDEAQVQRYFDAAQGLATEVMASDKLRARFVSCDLTDPGVRHLQHREGRAAAGAATPRPRGAEDLPARL